MSAIVRDHLLAIRADRGRLTPSVVVEVASDPKHPLHSHFEWNDTEAARKYRLVQARKLIASVAVVFHDGNGERRKTRGLISVARPTGPAYEPIDEIAQDPFATQMVLRQAEREWRNLKERYGHLRAFLDLVRADVA